MVDSALLSLPSDADSDYACSVMATIQQCDNLCPIESSGRAGIDDICTGLGDLLLSSTTSEPCEYLSHSGNGGIQSVRQYDIHLEPPRLPDLTFNSFACFSVQEQITSARRLSSVLPRCPSTEAVIDIDTRRQAIYLPSTSSFRRDSHSESQLPDSTLLWDHTTHRSGDAENCDLPPPYAFDDPYRARPSRSSYHRPSRSDWRHKLCRTTGYPYVRKSPASRQRHHNRASRTMEDNSSAMSKIVRDLPKTVQTAQKNWRIRRAKHKLAWLEKHRFLSAQERLLVEDIKAD